MKQILEDLKAIMVPDRNRSGCCTEKVAGFYPKRPWMDMLKKLNEIIKAVVSLDMCYSLQYHKDQHCNLARD